MLVMVPARRSCAVAVADALLDPADAAASPGPSAVPAAFANVAAAAAVAIVAASVAVAAAVDSVRRAFANLEECPSLLQETADAAPWPRVMHSAAAEVIADNQHY